MRFFQFNPLWWAQLSCAFLPAVFFLFFLCSLLLLLILLVRLRQPRYHPQVV